MKQLFEDLWETEVESPFPGLTTHAYLLTRDIGNVLFYNTSQQADIKQMGELGGVACHFLSHRDELGESIRQIRDLYGAKLGGHINEKSEFAEKNCAPDIVFVSREMMLGNIDVIPTPGHTPGSTCFQVLSPHGRTYLFTGDTLYFTNEGWKPGLLSFSDRDDLIGSMNDLQALAPDIVFSSAFSGKAGFDVVTGHWPEKVQQALDSLNQQKG